MKLLNGFNNGINGFFKAIPFIFKNNLWWTFFVPLLLNIFLYIAGFSFTDFFGDWIAVKLDSWITINPDNSWLKVLPGFLKGFIHVLFQILFFFLFSIFGGYIVLILLSPLFAWVSEQTDKILNQSEYPFSLQQFIKDIWRGILIAFRNLFYELGISFLVFLATFIPILGQIISPITFIIYFLITAYFYGFSYMDYTNERNKRNLKESINIIRHYSGLAIASGTLFYFSLLIPFCGVLLGGFVGIVSTVGATIAMNEVKQKD